MNLLQFLALSGAALQCSASLLPGTPEPEIEDGITGDLLPWGNDHATPPPPGPWDVEDFELINPRYTHEGKELFESDILLNPDQWEAIRERKGISYDSSRWTEGSGGYPLVPYVFSDSAIDQAAVKAGIDHWEEHTCIKFEKTTNANQAHLQFINGGGCWSYVGLSSSTGQQISIGTGCDSLGTVAHEIGHAMGFYHEQSRSDRDEHVEIKYDNIIKAYKRNFGKHDTNNYGVNYDYGSDMHYGSLGFTKNGKMTIVTKDPLSQELIKTRIGLSHRDKLLANKMYGCIDKWVSKCGLSSDNCQNEGYLGEKCVCVCPTGVSGANCETVTEDYYEHLRSPYTETITTEKTFKSVGGTKFTKKIVAPTCKKVQLTFEYFDLYRKLSHNNATYCIFEYVFIRFGSDLTEGENYCEQDISPGWSFTSETNTMILYSESRLSDGYSDGWSAKVEFVEDIACTTTKPATVVKCTKKAETHNLKPGDAIEIQSSNYPNYYSNGKCLWQVKGDGADNLKVSCTNFDLEAANKRGKCIDYLKIGRQKYCGIDGPVDITISATKLNKLMFKANKKKFRRGFSCTVTAL